MRGGDSAAERILPDERTADARGDAFDVRGVCVFLTGGGTGAEMFRNGENGAETAAICAETVKKA